MSFRCSVGRARLLVLLLLLATVVPSMAQAEDEAPAKTYDEMSPLEVQAEARKLQLAIKRLDRNDTAAGYGFALRREARLMVGGGLGLISGTLLVSGLALLVNENAKFAPLATSVGVPLGLGVLTSGLPAMILAPRFLGWYATNGPAPSHLARLKLLHRWGLEELRVRRDTALISTGFFGAATLLTMAVWAGRDRVGANGVQGGVYDPGDAVTALTFLAVTSVSGAMSLFWTLQYKDAMTNKHRLYLMPTVSVGPVMSPQDLRADASSAAGGVFVRGALSVAF